MKVVETFGNLEDLIRECCPAPEDQPFEVVYRKESYFVFAENSGDAMTAVALEKGMEANPVSYLLCSEAILAVKKPTKRAAKSAKSQSAEKPDADGKPDIPNLTDFSAVGLRELAKRKKITLPGTLEDPEEIRKSVIDQAKAAGLSIHSSNVPF